MGPLAAVERFLERLFERQSARLFRTGIRPVVILRRLERTMEDGRVRDGGRTIVPHRFVVRLHPDDLAALRAGAPDLAEVLADGALAFARHHGYTILDRPTVTIRQDGRVDRTDVAVDVALGGARPAAKDAPPAAGAPIGPETDEPDEDAADAPRGGPAAPGDPAEPRATPPPAADRTAVFVVPVADGPVATIREIRPDASGRTVRFDGRPMTVGRAPDNTLVLRDGRASRHHARIDARRGTLVLSDLGSTNGSWVNDRRVESVALGEGDRIRIGATILLVESIDPDPSAGPDGAAGRAGGAVSR